MIERAASLACDRIEPAGHRTPRQNVSQPGDGRTPNGISLAALDSVASRHPSGCSGTRQIQNSLPSGSRGGRHSRLRDFPSYESRWRRERRGVRPPAPCPTCTGRDAFGRGSDRGSADLQGDVDAIAAQDSKRAAFCHRTRPQSKCSAPEHGHEFEVFEVYYRAAKLEHHQREE